MTDGRYDIIIIGSGAGGGTAALRLAPTGKRILIIERGDYLPRERENWSSDSVFGKARYQATETWYDSSGNPFTPGLHYFVGGNTKVYGAALFRLRREDFGEIAHKDGISPAWPLKYEEFEPYYTAAEQLFHVHGERGADPTEPPASAPYPYPAVSHEPRIQEMSDAFKSQGYHPFPLPLGVLLDEKDGRVSPHSPCIRCDAFDGFPCMTNGKADAQIICIDPALAFPNVTLLTGAYVSTLETDESGRRITAVNVERGGKREIYSADIVIGACGALSTALLMLRSRSDKHPGGLANGSGLVGRNYMRHNNSAFMAISRRPNDTIFQKTLALNDFYFGAPDWQFPLGHIQMLGKSHGAQVKAEGLPAAFSWLSDQPFDFIARHSIDFWLTSEDLPDPENRITLSNDGRVTLHLKENNLEGHHRLKAKLESMLEAMDAHPHLIPRAVYPAQFIPIGGTAHQAGTMRFGPDPASSVLDLNCKAHELDNLYIVDASFFVSVGAVNPTLTIIANALRVADHLRDDVF